MKLENSLNTGENSLNDSQTYIECPGSVRIALLTPDTAVFLLRVWPLAEFLKVKPGFRRVRGNML